MKEAKAETKDDDSDSGEPTKGADASAAVSSQPQRIALFPGMDPSALKVILPCAFVRCIHHTSMSYFFLWNTNMYC